MTWWSELRKGNFNPRSPHGERRRAVCGKWRREKISIHAPRTGSDIAAPQRRMFWQVFQSTLPARGATARWRTSCGARRFQSTLPARGATADDDGHLLDGRISIHAPRTGSDAFPCPASRAYSNFNPRSPHGERLTLLDCLKQPKNFNPRSPHGERRIQDSDYADSEQISIHAPRTGSDQPFRKQPMHQHISIHAPRTGSDFRIQCPSSLPPYFNPRSPHGERRCFSVGAAALSHFNPRSPHGERLDRFDPLGNTI